jgi:hypothetical protein
MTELEGHQQQILQQQQRQPQQPRRADASATHTKAQETQDRKAARQAVAESLSREGRWAELPYKVHTPGAHRERIAQHLSKSTTVPAEVTGELQSVEITMVASFHDSTIPMGQNANRSENVINFGRLNLDDVDAGAASKSGLPTTGATAGGEAGDEDTSGSPSMTAGGEAGDEDTSGSPSMTAGGEAGDEDTSGSPSMHLYIADLLHDSRDANDGGPFLSVGHARLSSSFLLLSCFEQGSLVLVLVLVGRDWSMVHVRPNMRTFQTPAHASRACSLT